MPDGTTRDPEFGQDSLSPSLPGQSVVDLRILATTDLHMHLWSCLGSGRNCLAA